LGGVPLIADSDCNEPGNALLVREISVV